MNHIEKVCQNWYEKLNITSATSGSASPSRPGEFGAEIV